MQASKMMSLCFVGTWMNLENIILSKLRTENEIPHVLTHRHVLNDENTWTQGGEHYTLGSVGVVPRERLWGVGSLGRDNMGRNARCG